MAASFHTFNCDRFSMDYAVFGDGKKTMVMVPGMSLRSVIPSANAVAGAYSVFKKAYKVYLVDYRKDIPEGYTIADMAEDLAEMMHGLGLEGACVFGTSMGGMISLAMTVGHPELVSKLAVSSTMVRHCARSMESISGWKELAESGDRIALNRDVFSKVYSPGFQEKYSRALKMLEDEGTAEELHRFATLARATEGFDIMDKISGIKCPVFAFGVEDDTVLSCAGTRDIIEATGCKSHIFPGSGHAVYDEDPHFKDMLFDFFES